MSLNPWCVVCRLKGKTIDEQWGITEQMWIIDVTTRVNVG
jgi:hypothetical protein